MLDRIVVVGGSLAGLRAVESLRAGGYDREVVVVGAESHRPYDRPPLSKKLLAGDWEPDRIELRKPDDLDALGATWRLGAPATALDVGARRLTIADGSDVAFDAIVVATGSAPRRLPGQETWPHVVELRTLDDALRDRLRAALRRDLSPRHVPDAIEEVPGVPRTLSGKKQELPIKKLLLGQPLEQVVNREAMANPGCLDWYVEFARAHAARQAAPSDAAARPGA